VPGCIGVMRNKGALLNATPDDCDDCASSVSYSYTYTVFYFVVITHPTCTKHNLNAAATAVRIRR